MKNKKQIIMLEKISKILQALPTSTTIREISNKTEIPQTTVHNYLHNKELISDFLGISKESEEYKEFFNLIQKWLDRAKQEGPARGAIVLEERYRYSSNRRIGK